MRLDPLRAPSALIVTLALTFGCSAEGNVEARTSVSDAVVKGGDDRTGCDRHRRMKLVVRS